MKPNTDIRMMVRGIYSLQKLRIQCGNRIVSQFKAKLGQGPSMPEDTLDDRSKELLKKLRSTNKLLADGASAELKAAKTKRVDPENITEIDDDAEATAEAKAEKKIAKIVKELIEINFEVVAPGEVLPKKKDFTGNPIISNYVEACLIQNYFEVFDQEETAFNRLGCNLVDFPIYTEYLKTIKGIGPAMAGVLISELDVSKATYASSFHKYCGLDVAGDGRGRSKYAEHLIDVEYIDKKGKPDTKKSITFNPFIKTKLTGVLGPSFLRAKSPYSELYYDYKNRLNNHPEHAKKSDLHKHRMAIRYMVKIFLQNLWCEWRKIEGLSVSAPYATSKLNLSDHGLEESLISKYGSGYSKPSDK